MLKELLNIIKDLWSRIKALESEVIAKDTELSSHQRELAQLKRRIQELEQKGKKNSQNSSKAPSSDDKSRKGKTGKKPKNNRYETNRASGAQKGNAGKTLEQVDQADEKILYSLEVCDNCGADLSAQAVIGVEKRQVFDTSEAKIEVLEHQVEVKLCWSCGKKVKSAYPSHIKAPVQYGSQIRGQILDLNTQHFLSYERIQNFFLDWYGHRISGGLIQDSLQKAKEILGGSYATHLQAKLLKQEVLHTDETGVYIANKRQWLHVLSTPKLTWYHAHASRGSEAIEQAGIVGQYTGRLIHDNFKSYATYDQCQHGLCHAHHLRELRYFEEEEQAMWAWRMGMFLRSVKYHRDDLIAQDIEQFDAQQLRQYRQQYFRIIEYGRQHAPPDPPRKSKRGRAPQHPQRNLLKRFDDQHEAMLAFVEDFRVPFDNNQAERDLRMIKTKQKVSGTFRSQQGAHAFAAIRGYLATVKKNSQNVLQQFVNIFDRKPFCP